MVQNKRFQVPTPFAGFEVLIRIFDRGDAMVTLRRSAVRFTVIQSYGTLENWLQIPKAI